MISVCLASYNGLKFLPIQIDSILSQLTLNDELIIVDDCSTDSTYEYLLSLNDSRIRIFQNDFNLGVIKTFERAIYLAEGDFIFLSDQDDVWLEGHVDVLVEKLLLENCDLVSSNFSLIDSCGNFYGDMITPLKEEDSKKYFINIIKIFIGNIYYYGCCMAFKRRLIPSILPFPTFIQSHDLWIAKNANLMSTNMHVENVLLLRRIHGSNVSVVNRKFISKIFSRYVFLISIILIYFRRFKKYL
jgi:glycosyltransferase involved in cell wall biosynthesis